MNEHRQNFITMFATIERMENMGMIKINRPQYVEEEQDKENTWKDALIGAGIIVGLILFGAIL